MVLKIHSYPNNDRVMRAKIAALYVGAELEEIPVSLPISGDMKERVPLGKVPFLETEDGSIVFESLAIVYYISGLRADMDLLGRSHLEKARVVSWLSYVEAYLSTSFPTLLFPHFRPDNFKTNPMEEKSAEEGLLKVLKALDAHLTDHTYLASERVTVADIAIMPTLKRVFENIAGDDVRSQIPHVMRFFNTCMGKANFAAVLGEVKLCEKSLRQKRDEQVKAKKAAEKAEKAKAKEATAAQPAAAPPAEKKEKPKHPLDLLPPSPFVMDEWKRQYSNNDTRPVALPWLWENFDKEGYTFWFCKYKYNDELQKTFMAANLITGWFQRIEHVRKYLFGNVHVFGKSGEGVEISGVWIIRGTMDPTDDNLMGKDDAAYYDWRKMTSDDAADKALIEDYCAWDGEFKGASELEFNQGKTLK
uniref:Glutathione transferase n=1 Tax=Rhodosorus marinus TaxID=101924 RepID=A0A7S2Z965_9RHOD|mmetsp:Transcript_10748/g.44805  ORF Transcript_10748/g.44805 Transcript_10748/m.44805 type:complete len:418 (+) Transcript_10748:130-1383(+)